MKKVLGRGLSALIPDTYVNKEALNPGRIPSEAPRHMSAQGLEIIPLSKIRPNHDQPRKIFKDEEIRELAASIQEKGILQPVIVKKLGENDYELICGERRMRAAEACGLKEVPAVVKDLAEEDFLEWALIENIQREDLNPIEEAEAYRKLSDERMISHEDISKRLGKSRTAITNTLRLLRLPDEVQTYISEGMISAGHARALLALMTPEHQRQMARRIVEENLTVRQIEAIVNRSIAHKRKAKRARLLTPEVADLENKMSRHLGTKVKIYPRKNQKQGRIEFYYYSLDDLDRVIQQIHLPRE